MGTDSDDTGPSLWPGTPPHMGVFFADMTGDGQIVWARGSWMPPGDALMAVDVVGDVKPYLLASVKTP